MKHPASMAKFRQNSTRNVRARLRYVLYRVRSSRSSSRSCRAFSRSRLPRVDERDQAVSRKSAWLAYRIVANGCWIVSLAALVVYGISRIPAALAVTITLDAVTIGAFAALLGAEVYYEKRM